MGYRLYVDLIQDMLDGKKIVSSGMRHEIERCETAIELASQGETVALISSGDPGIYGMAGPLLELMQNNSEIDVEIVPGVSAVQAAAALAGAPIMNDFAVVSLSDLMMPWEAIEQRLEGAASGDFVIALYNPKSKKRVEQIVNAQKIIKKYRDGSTPVLVAKNVNREGAHLQISTLDQFPNEEIGMLSIVIVGNSQTYMKNGKMVTHRGYKIPVTST